MAIYGDGKHDSGVIVESIASNIRDTAVDILETIADKLGNEDIFDNDWYAYEDIVINKILQLQD